MSFLSAIGAGLQLLLLLFTAWFKHGDEKKAERKVLTSEAVDAIKSRDAGRITAVFDAINRM